MTPVPIILKWAGSKEWLAERVCSHFPQSPVGVYREPFVGGAAVFRESWMRTGHVLLSDLSPDLISFYVALRDDVETVIEEITDMRDEYLAADKRQRELIYYARRDAFNERRACRSFEAARQAARYLFLNKTCFNGLMRYNRDGNFNTPHAKYVRPKMFDSLVLLSMARALRGVSLSCLDYKEALLYVCEGDLVYLDPPHATRSKTARFTSYTGDAWTKDDDEEVCREFWRLARLGARVVMSQADTPRMRELLAGAEVEVVMRSGTMSSNGTGRQDVPELLAVAGSVAEKMTR